MINKIRILIFNIFIIFIVGYLALSISFSTDLENKTSHYNKGIDNLLVIYIDSFDNLATPNALVLITVDSNNGLLRLTSISPEIEIYSNHFIKSKIKDDFLYNTVDSSLNSLNYSLKLNIDKYVILSRSSLVTLTKSLDNIYLNDRLYTANNILDLISNNSSNPSHSYISNFYVHLTQSIIYKLSTTPFSKYPYIISTCLPTIKTNLNITSMVSLGLKGLKVNNYTAKTYYFPTGSTINYDENSIYKLHNFIYNR